MCIVPFGLWEYLPRQSSSYLKITHNSCSGDWGGNVSFQVLSGWEWQCLQSIIFLLGLTFLLLVKNMTGIHISIKNHYLCKFQWPTTEARTGGDEHGFVRGNKLLSRLGLCGELGRLILMMELQVSRGSWGLCTMRSVPPGWGGKRAMGWGEVRWGGLFHEFRTGSHWIGCWLSRLRSARAASNTLLKQKLHWTILMWEEVKHAFWFCYCGTFLSCFILEQQDWNTALQLWSCGSFPVLVTAAMPDSTRQLLLLENARPPRMEHHPTRLNHSIWGKGQSPLFLSDSYWKNSGMSHII